MASSGERTLLPVATVPARANQLSALAPLQRVTIGIVWGAALVLAAGCRQQDPSDVPRIDPKQRQIELGAAAQVPESVENTRTVALPSPATAPSPPQDHTTTVLADITVGRDVLVWQEVKGKTRTHWVHIHGAASQVLGSRDGLWLAARDDIYGWKQTRRRVRACEPAACNDPDGSCESVMVGGGPFQGRIEDVELVALTTGKKRPLGPKLPDSAALDLGTPGLHRYIRPTAQLGPLLLVQVVTETLSCGPMHGDTAVEPRQAVVPDGALQPIADASLEAQLLQSIAAADLAVLSAEHPQAVGPMQWLTLHLSLGTDGAWALEHEFGRQQPSEVGPAVLRTARARVAVLPAAWQEHWSAAPALAEVADELPAQPKELGEVHAGWSWVRQLGDQKSVLQKQFLASSKAP